MLSALSPPCVRVRACNGGKFESVGGGYIRGWMMHRTLRYLRIYNQLVSLPTAQLHRPPSNALPLLRRQRDAEILPQRLHPLVLALTNPHHRRLPAQIPLHGPIDHHHLGVDLTFIFDPVTIFIPPQQEFDNQHHPRLETRRALTGVEIHHLKVRACELQLGEAVAAVPVRPFRIAVLVDPQPLVLGGLFGDGGADEAEVLLE